MSRTDRGDSEPKIAGKPRIDEWIYKSFAGCVDKPGDDDVEIILPFDTDGEVEVRYLNDKRGC